MKKKIQKFVTQLNWRGISGDDSVIGTFVLTQNTIDRVEEYFNNGIQWVDVEIYNDSEYKANQFKTVLKAAIKTKIGSKLISAKV